MDWREFRVRVGRERDFGDQLTQFLQGNVTRVLPRRSSEGGGPGAGGTKFLS
jgi:hypothetical protein